MLAEIRFQRGEIFLNIMQKKGQLSTACVSKHVLNTAGLGSLASKIAYKTLDTVP